MYLFGVLATKNNQNNRLTRGTIECNLNGNDLGGFISCKTSFAIG